MTDQHDPLGDFRARVESLHPRLRSVLELAAEGHDNATIARRLGVAVPVVKTYVSSLYAAFDPPRDRPPRAWLAEQYRSVAGDGGGSAG